MSLFNRKNILGTLIFLQLIATMAFAEVSQEKEKDIKKLLEVSGILSQLNYMQDSLLNSVSLMVTGSFPKVPDTFWKEFNQLVGNEQMDDLVNRIVPVYAKHMSQETIQKLITMFETPFWNQWKKKMPEISREAGVIGSAWGREYTQSKAFNDRLDGLIKKYELEKLNKAPENKR